MAPSAKVSGRISYLQPVYWTEWQTKIENPKMGKRNPHELLMLIFAEHAAAVA